MKRGGDIIIRNKEEGVNNSYSLYSVSGPNELHGCSQQILWLTIVVGEGGSLPVCFKHESVQKISVNYIGLSGFR